MIGKCEAALSAAAAADAVADAMADLLRIFDPTRAKPPRKVEKPKGSGRSDVMNSVLIVDRQAAKRMNVNVQQNTFDWDRWSTPKKYKDIERDTLQLVVDIEPPNSSQNSGLSCAYPSTRILNSDDAEMVDSANIKVT